MDAQCAVPAAFSVGQPTSEEFTQLTHTIAHRVARYLKRLCRYIARPAVSTKRLSLTRHGKERYELKTPYNDGTTHVLFEPLDFMYRMYGMPRVQGCARAAISRLAALVPKPRVHLTRFHGVFAPHSKYRVRVTPARRGKGKKANTTRETGSNSCRAQSMAQASLSTGSPSHLLNDLANPARPCATRHRDILTNGHSA